MSSLRVTVEVRCTPLPVALTVASVEVDLDRGDEGITREDVSRIVADAVTGVARLTIEEDS